MKEFTCKRVIKRKKYLKLKYYKKTEMKINIMGLVLITLTDYVFFDPPPYAESLLFTQCVELHLFIII